MCLTATATQSMVDEILKAIQLDPTDIDVIAVLPDRWIF